MNAILNSEDPTLYAAERYGNFRYVIPVADRVYTLRLFFAETWWGDRNPGGSGEGSRVFDVLCNGGTLLGDIDSIAMLGKYYEPVLTFRHRGAARRDSRPALRAIPGFQTEPPQDAAHRGAKT
jgi:hypothetical protein